jgi:hypothetical protein
MYVKYTPEELNLISAYKTYVTARYDVQQSERNFGRLFSRFENKKRMRKLLRASAQEQGTSDFIEDLLKSL